MTTLAKRWFIDAFSGMALGLFATLIIGTIIGQIGDGRRQRGKQTHNQYFQHIKSSHGRGIGAGIAYVLKPTS